MAAALPKICVSIVESTIEEAARVARVARARGACCEIRIDAIDGANDLTAEALAPLFAEPATIATWRLPMDGGRSEIGEAKRLALLATCARRYGVWCDIEASRADRIDGLGLDRSRLILSHHDLRETPSDAPDVVERMFGVEAAAYKFASLATNGTDQFVHFDLMARGRAAGKPMVAIAMGVMGQATRILGPSHGAPLTYCAIDGDRTSAPGQLTLDDATDLYRVDTLTRDTLVLGLAGGHIPYSLSPRMHNGAAAAHGIDAVYVPFELDDLGPFVEGGVRGARAGWRMRGLSITNPFKKVARDLCDEVDRVSVRAGAVNTLAVEGGKLRGYNTDAEGFLAPLEAARPGIATARIGILGTGGAARGALAALESRGSTLFVIGRDSAAASALADEFGAEAAEIEDIGALQLDVLVNATPVGTSGPEEDQSPVPAGSLRGIELVYDLVYSPEQTRLRREAEKAGGKTIGGLPMLATQAARQFALWTGVEVTPDEMLVYAATATSRRPST